MILYKNFTLKDVIKKIHKLTQFRVILPFEISKPDTVGVKLFKVSDVRFIAENS